MTQHKYSIFAICLLALGLLLSGCNQGGSVEEAQAEVEAAKAELEAAKQEQKKQSEVDSAEADLKAARQELRAERANHAAAHNNQAKAEPVCNNCGTITAITERKTQGSNTSKGAIAGGVIGAVAGVVAGNQIGSGSGKDIARVVGGIGGAAAGQQIGKRIDTDTYYAVSINMEAGGSQTINVPSSAGLAIGQQVRVEGGNIVLR